jgi:hypothetical protein
LAAVLAAAADVLADARAGVLVALAAVPLDVLAAADVSAVEVGDALAGAFAVDFAGLLPLSPVLPAMSISPS